MTSDYCYAAWTMVAALVMASPTFGADQNESWQAVLKQVLASEKKCQLHEIQWVREVPLGGQVGLEGRIRCADGREFDFTRPRPHMKFEVQLCQPTVC